MGATGVDTDPVVRLAALLSTRPAELVAAVRRAAGRDLTATLDSPVRLRALVVREHLRQRGPVPAPDPAAAPAPEPVELAELARRIATLDRLDRAVLVLVGVEHLTRAEVAGLVDRPLGTVDRAHERADTVIGPDLGGLLGPWSLTAGREVDTAALRQAERQLTRRRRSRSRRRGVVMAGVLVVIGALVATGTALRPSPGPVAVRAVGDWVQSFVLPATGDWTVTTRTVRADVELAVLTPAANRPGRCQVVVDQRTSAGGATGERSVRVRGRPGRLTAGDDQAALAWALAPGATAAVSCTAVPDPTRVVTALADQLVFAPQPIRLAYRLTTLPNAFHVDQLILRPLEQVTVVELWPDDTAPTAPPISLNQSPTAMAPTAGPGPQTGLRTCWPSTGVELCVGVADPGLIDSPAEQRRTERRLQTIRSGTVLATQVGDPSTWFDARDGLPRG